MEHSAFIFHKIFLIVLLVICLGLLLIVGIKKLRIIISNHHDPIKSINASLVEIKTQMGAINHNKVAHYYACFKSDSQTIELMIDETMVDRIKAVKSGILTYRGHRFISFE